MSTYRRFEDLPVWQTSAELYDRIDEFLVNFTAELAALISLAESCSRQLRRWAGSLQNSDVAGPKFLNRRKGPASPTI